MLTVNDDRRCLKLSCNLFSKHMYFYDFQKTNGRFWALTCYGVHWRRTVDHRCCSFLRCSSFCNFMFMETIPNCTDSCLKACSRSPKVYNHCRRSIYCYFGQAELKRDLTCVTFMVTASIGKVISAATVCWRLHMSELYTRVSWVCVFLSVQLRGAQLKWCWEHVNWTVSDWGNVIFTDKSRFALEPDDKRIKIWRE